MMMDIDGVLVHVRDEGGGQPVLLLHGWLGQIDSFAPVSRALLTDGRRVIALDFPGHGQSALPPEAWSVTEYARMTAELIQRLGIAGCDVIGHSFGARVAILLASTRPQLVGRMVLTGAAGLRKPPTLGRRLRHAAMTCVRAALRLLGPKKAEAMRKRLAFAMGSADYRATQEGMRKTFSRVVEQDLRPYLPNIKAPTLLIWGENDAETPLSFGRIMEKEIPGAGLAVLKDAGHFAYLDKCADFMKIVRVFFA